MKYTILSLLAILLLPLAVIVASFRFLTHEEQNEFRDLPQSDYQRDAAPALTIPMK